MSKHTPTSNLPLFSDPPAPKARQTDPETSKDAASSMADTAETHRQKILSALRDHGRMTGDAIDDLFGWKHATANRRLPELRSLGLVEMTDATAHTRSGRSARLWRAIERREE